MLEILNKFNQLERIRGPDNGDVRVFFCEGFSLGQVIITKIISHTNKKTACNTDKNHSSAENSKLKRGIMSVYLTYLCINLIGFYMF